MELRELEFKLKDCDLRLEEGLPYVDVDEFDKPTDEEFPNCYISLARANRILNEKLAKAPEIEIGLDGDLVGRGPEGSHYRARLVMIEEIK